MKTYKIYENGACFAEIQARTARAALNKAAKRFPRRAADYNGYVGEITWRACEDGQPFGAEIELQVTARTVADKRAVAALAREDGAA